MKNITRAFLNQADNKQSLRSLKQLNVLQCIFTLFVVFKILIRDQSFDEFYFQHTSYMKDISKQFLTQDK